MKKASAIVGGAVLLTTGLVWAAAPHEFCPHVDELSPPKGCASGDELLAYERGARNGVFIVDYAFDSYGDCSAWTEIAALIDRLKDYYSNLDSTDAVDLCRIGGLTDAISDRKAELGGVACCNTIPNCPHRGHTDGHDYADTFCRMVIARDACFDPSEYTRGPVVRECADDFVLPCVERFTSRSRDDPDCSKFTDTTDEMDCLEPFHSYRDSICHQ